MSNLVVVLSEDGQHFQVFRHDGASAPVEVTREFEVTWGRAQANTKEGEVLFGFHVGKRMPVAMVQEDYPAPEVTA